MNIVVFDTETTSIEKPFCYNIGYKIANIESGDVLVKRDFVVEQVWHNPMLFTTAYYSNKRDVYVSRMKAKKCVMEKFGYITQQMIRDFKAYEVELAFAYNSPFDKGVFEFNCEWFKCNNPFDDLEIKDIMNYVHTFIAFREEYQQFLENAYIEFGNKIKQVKEQVIEEEEKEKALKFWKERQARVFTESGNYSTSAENVFCYMSNNLDFIEEHTALADSEIEFEILRTCIVEYGAEINGNYKRYSSIPKRTPKELKIIDTDGVEHSFSYVKRRNYQDGNKIILKNN